MDADSVPQKKWLGDGDCKKLEQSMRSFETVHKYIFIQYNFIYNLVLLTAEFILGGARIYADI